MDANNKCAIVCVFRCSDRWVPFVGLGNEGSTDAMGVHESLLPHAGVPLNMYAYARTYTRPRPRSDQQ